jgi:hypothetical protein
MKVQYILLVSVVSFAIALLQPCKCMAQSVKLTPQAAEWTKKNPDKKLAKFTFPGQKEPFIFEGDYYHEGVDLTAMAVTEIQRDHVFAKAEAWVAESNKNPDHPFVRIAGIEYIGPKEGRAWEDKGEKRDALGISRGRYHKFGGIGRAYILVYP